MKKLLRIALPVTIAGTALFGVTTTAQAGTWIDVDEFNTLSQCKAAAPAAMQRYGADTYTCDTDSGRLPYLLRVFVR
ncbi:hypothetical protein AB0L00_26500 [Actinoallomurus sp. NPDC052308]|uniref:hypothetical protein n=1 Tax=Actinoallomurus sp. NPDC052308 TaxID=3155530 RepID=UPI0034366393